MRTATTIEASAGKDAVEFAVEAERLGLDVCWVAEAWGADAPSPLGYLAARTEKMLLGSGVIQVGTRSPVTIAQTAMTLAHLSGGRFLLGLGVSGPQVMEGLHGVPFGHPLGRMRETVEIVRAVFTGEKVTYAGRHYDIPLARREADAGQPAAGVGAGVPGHAVAQDAGADRRDRRRLARHQLHPRAGRRLPVPPGRGPGPVRPDPGRPGHLPGRRDQPGPRGRAGRHHRQPQEGTGLLPRRHGHGHGQLLQRRLQPPGLGRGRRRGPRPLAGRRPGRRGRPGHRRDGAGHHADRHRGHGPRPATGLARRRRGHRPPLPVRRHPDRPPRHPGPRHRPGPGPGRPERSGSASFARPGNQPAGRPCSRAIPGT